MMKEKAMMKAKSYDEGRKLIDEGEKLHDEGRKLYAEGRKLYAEGSSYALKRRTVRRKSRPSRTVRSDLPGR